MQWRLPLPAYRPVAGTAISYPCGTGVRALLASELRSLRSQSCAHPRPCGAESWGQLIRGVLALRAAVGETGFIRLQLELFRADGADFDGESHLRSMIRRS